MSKRKRILVFLLSILIAVSSIPFAASAARDEGDRALPSVSARSAILIEATTGAALFEKDADVPLPMASTTKMMTALVAVGLAPLDTVITVDPAACGVEGSSVYLAAGERLRLDELLFALLLESANDAAVAVAIGLCGSVEGFVAKMNETAEGLGLRSTHFENPNGLPAASHITTARELARIAAELLNDPFLRSVVATKKETIPQGGVEDRRLLVNHNRLLWRYDGCIGVKTGYTKQSGRCLVSAAERGGVTLIAVTLDDPDDWADHTALLDYGFSKIRSLELCRAGDITFDLPLVGGAESSVRLESVGDLSVILPVGHFDIVCTIECRRFEYAPIERGTVCGFAVFRCDRDGDGQAEVIGSVPLTATRTVEKKKAPSLLSRIRERLFSKE